MIDLIIAKRKGAEHSQEALSSLIKEMMAGSIPDYQLSAWLMAVCFQGMTSKETAFLTDAMAHSGKVLDLAVIGPLVADKHSTGGVGDKTTLIFVPLLAAAGVPIAKLSGRGLGHTGGTIDKLEAIPGFRTELTVNEFIKQVQQIGMAIGSQTQELAPADGKIYALRDVTGTVESIPLIAASVMSKKIAAGTNLILLDVKAGNGAFMQTDDSAIALAQTMHDIGITLGRPVIAAVTNMDQPLGYAIGHSVEVIEAIETLKGRGPADLTELCLRLGAMALVRAGKSENEVQAKAKLQDLITSGAALQKFKQLLEFQGGNPLVLDNYDLMPHTAKQFTVLSSNDKTAWVASIDSRSIAEACKLMGAGRTVKGDKINLAVGVVLNAKAGDPLTKGQVLATVHCDSEEQFKTVVKPLILNAFRLSEKPVEPPLLIKKIIA